MRNGKPKKQQSENNEITLNSSDRQVRIISEFVIFTAEPLINLELSKTSIQVVKIKDNRDDNNCKENRGKFQSGLVLNSSLVFEIPRGNKKSKIEVTGCKFSSFSEIEFCNEIS
jgi:hypothetical protein